MLQIDKNALKEILLAYKDQLTVYRKDELYKWEAVKHFQEHWDPNAEDVYAMLDEALAKSHNLLMGANYFPKGMLLVFAEESPYKTLEAINKLFDNSKDLKDRLITFEEDGRVLLEELNSAHAVESIDPVKSSYFDSGSASVYLAFRYPETFYLYKAMMYKTFSTMLGIKAETNKFNKVLAYNELCDTVLDYLKNEAQDVIAMSDELLPEHLKSVDPDHHLLVQDIVYFTDSYYKELAGSKNANSNEYDPEISVETWLDLLSDPTITNEKNLVALNRLLEANEATCKQLSLTYGETMNFYNANISSFSKRVAEKTHCPLEIRDNNNPRYWAVCCTGKQADQEQPGVFVWKLRPELEKALSLFNEDENTEVLSDSAQSNFPEPTNYWWIVANPAYWSFNSIQIGETVKYTSYNENGHKRRIFKYFEEAKVGDLVVGYHSAPEKQIVALCRVASELDDESEEISERGLLIQKVADIPRGLLYSELKADPLLASMEFIAGNPTGTLFKLQKNQYERIIELTEKPELEPYTDNDFLNEVFIESEDLHALTSLLKRKKNLILQGAPGTGKTFAAKRLAYNMMGVKDPKRIEIVQFHQSTTYDEFVVGYRPSEDAGFKVQEGVFTRFCKKAASDPENDYFFIIDEINRANISKVFGELLMLIESDHRDETISLPVGGTDFKVPRNLYIIGMMNTADRGLALIDYALRRRFAFYEMKPAFTNEHFKSEVARSKRVARLVSAVEKLNKEIENDPALGRGFCIGHSYFCAEGISDDDADLILNYEIVPLIEEYWFDDQDKTTKEIAKLKAAIQ